MDTPTNSPQTFILFGRSGSGKGTQAAMLIKYLEEQKNRKVFYVETGQRFRDFLARDNYTSRLTGEVMKKGALIPPFLPIWIWTDFFIDNMTGDEDMVLDGLCRVPSEAAVLDSAMKFYKREKPTIVYIRTSYEWSFARLKGRGRSDDSDEYIKSRLEWFDWNVVPAMAFFHDNPDYCFVEVNGEQTPEEVHAEILSKTCTI